MRSSWRLDLRCLHGQLRNSAHAVRFRTAAQAVDHLQSEVGRTVRKGLSGRFALGYYDARGAFRTQLVERSTDLSSSRGSTWGSPPQVVLFMLRKA